MSLPRGILDDLTTLSPIAKTAALLTRRVQQRTPRASIASGRASLYDAAQILHSCADTTSTEVELDRELPAKLESIITEGNVIVRELDSLRDTSVSKQLRRIVNRSRLWARASAFETSAAAFLTEVKTEVTRRLAAGLATTAGHSCFKSSSDPYQELAMASIRPIRDVLPDYSPAIAISPASWGPMDSDGSFSHFQKF